MGVGAAQEGHVKHAREAEVVGEHAAAGEESRRLRPDDGLSNVAVGLIDHVAVLHAFADRGVCSTGWVAARVVAVARMASTMA